MEQTIKESKQLTKTFYDYDGCVYAKAKAGSFRMIHYTDIGSAEKILSNSTFRMKSYKGMNDSAEIEYGRGLLAKPRNQNFLRKVLNKVSSKLWPEAYGIFDDYFTFDPGSPYIASFSKHRDADKDFARLLMWRGYGGDKGVGLVLNLEPFVSKTIYSNVISLPVSYFTEAKFEEALLSFASSIERDVEVLKKLSYEDVKWGLVYKLLYFVMSVKHPAFSEEEEWRLLYLPQSHNRDYIITKEVELAAGNDGINEKCFEIQLKNFKVDLNLEISNVLDEILIGPTENVAEIRGRLERSLLQSGVVMRENMIRETRIPFRFNK